MAALTSHEKEALLGQMIQSRQGRDKVAASMVSPLRSKLDYRGVGRKALVVDTLPAGVLPYYDKDIDVAAVVVGEDGETPEANVRGERILVPLFELATNPKVSVTQVMERKFAVLRRIQDKAVQAMQELEDTRIFSALEDACAINDLTSINVTGYLDRDSMVDAFAQIETQDLRVANIFCNALDYADVRKWGRDQLDPNTQEELLKTGVMGSIWQAQITTSRTIPAGKVFVCTEPDFLGVMPVRTELTVWPADDPSNRKLGWSIFEQVGIGIHNVNGVIDINISR